MSETVYVRFGDLPKSGRSWNWLTKEWERGVSVYEAIIRDGKPLLILPSPALPVAQSVCHCLQRPAYRVTGDVVGRGGDGEPVLANVRIIEALKQEAFRVNWKIYCTTEGPRTQPAASPIFCNWKQDALDTRAET
jgi:hypothetical protein